MVKTYYEKITEETKKRQEEAALIKEIEAGRVSVSGLQKEKPKIDKPITQPITQPVMLRDAETGRITGIRLPDGRDFPNIGKEEALGLLENWRGKRETPAGAIEVGEAQRLEEAQRLKEEGAVFAQRVGQLPPDVIADIQAGRIDIKEALGAGVTGALPGVVGGAITGATVGALGGPVGAVGGAVVGATAGFLTGIISNVRGQFGGEISAANVEYRRIEQNIRGILTDTNRNPQNAAQNVNLFNYQMALMHQSYQELKIQDNRARKFGKDATPELARFEIFYTTGGGAELFIREMRVALVNPDPNKSFLTYEEAVAGEI